MGYRRSRIRSTPRLSQRLFTVGGISADEPAIDLASVQQPWVVCSNTSVAAFSAVAFFGGRALADADPRVPLGLISNNVGGTAIGAYGCQAPQDRLQPIK